MRTLRVADRFCTKDHFLLLAPQSRLGVPFEIPSKRGDFRELDTWGTAAEFRTRIGDRRPVKEILVGSDGAEDVFRKTVVQLNERFPCDQEIGHARWSGVYDCHLSDGYCKVDF